MQNPCKRRDINTGMHVRIVEKKNQKEGITTDGIVARILTNSPEHPHGIKVQLSNGAVGRVKEIISIRSLICGIFLLFTNRQYHKSL